MVNERLEYLNVILGPGVYGNLAFRINTLLVEEDWMRDATRFFNGRTTEGGGGGETPGTPRRKTFCNKSF